MLGRTMLYTLLRQGYGAQAGIDYHKKYSVVSTMAVTGSFHYGVGKYLRLSNADPTILRDNARRYWSESAEANPVAYGRAQIEILCNGTVTIQREINVNGPKPGLFATLKQTVLREPEGVMCELLTEWIAMQL